MKINGISNNTNNNYTPTFKKLSDVIAYPELLEYYDISEINAFNSDALTTDPLKALINKFAKAYRLLFTPVPATASNIKEGIDTMFEAEQVGKNLDQVA